MSALVWIHDDRLSRANEALCAHAGAPALYVFDDALMRARGYGLKRIGFIYECLLDLPVTILRGPLVATLKERANALGAGVIATTATPCPHLRQAMETLSQEMRLDILEPPAFVEPSRKLDLRRFSRYWRQVQDDAMRPRSL